MRGEWCEREGVEEEGDVAGRRVGGGVGRVGNCRWVCVRRANCKFKNVRTLSDKNCKDN